MNEVKIFFFQRQGCRRPHGSGGGGQTGTEGPLWLVVSLYMLVMCELLYSSAFACPRCPIHIQGRGQLPPSSIRASDAVIVQRAENQCVKLHIEMSSLEFVCSFELVTYLNLIRFLCNRARPSAVTCCVFLRPHTQQTSNDRPTAAVSRLHSPAEHAKYLPVCERC